MVQLNFDARTVEPSTGFEPVPAGWYNVMIDESEMRPTKKGDGSYLNLRMNILDGQYANQKIFTRLNLRNPSPPAQEIAHKTLSAFCHATGVMMLQDSNQLHGIPLKVRVKVRKDEEYGDSNDVTMIKNINEPTPGQAAAPAGVVTPAAPAAPAAPQGWAPSAPTPAAPVATVPATPAPAPIAAPVAPTVPVQQLAPPPPTAPTVQIPVPPAAPPPVADPYQYTPDGKQRWKPGMAAWEPVPETPAPTPAAPQQTWQPPAAQQPWQAAAPANPTPPAAPIPPAAPPWQR